MRNTPFSAEEIAAFLHDNPDFFQTHADVFTQMRVPHPHDARAISLGERQILTLRDKLKTFERQLGGLIYQAKGNEKTSSAVIAWCARLLAERDAALVPHHIVQGLSDLFDLPAVALRLWNLRDAPAGAFTADVTSAIQAFATDLAAPWCGVPQNQPVLAWLPTPPASLAIVPLRLETEIGLLVLGSDDAQRFAPDMGTVFLSMLGELTAAALNRLR